MRVKRGVTKRKAHKKILKANKGYRMSKHRLISAAYEAYNHASQYAFNGRRKRKGQMREIWIKRINAAVTSQTGDESSEKMSYSKFINALKKANVEINRKMLSELAANEPEVFSYILNQVKA